MDEAFELFTLVQTGKSNLRPIVLLDIPGGTYWENWEKYIRQNLYKAGLISPSDMHLFFLTHDVDAAVGEITNFYRVYHSIRYVNKWLVIRLKNEISDALVAKLNKEFRGILAKASIEKTKAFPEEINDNDHVGLPRLVLSFNHKDYGLLRKLIDRINKLG